LPPLIQRQPDDLFLHLPKEAQVNIAAGTRNNCSKATPATKPEHLGKEQFYGCHWAQSITRSQKHFSSQACPSSTRALHKEFASATDKENITPKTSL
jgi:hypothetical protein